VRQILARVTRGWRDESGQALVLGSVCILTLLGFAGLAIDVGQIRYQKRQMQAAVDAAAMAGAIEMSTCGSTSDCSAMTTASKAALAENGYTVQTPLTQCATNSSTSLTLWVNNGPCYMGSTTADPNYGSTKYVEAVLTGPVNTIFAGALGFKSMKVTVRAEAAGAPSTYCLVVSADSASSTQGITLQGGSSGGISAPTCGIYDDDTSSSNAVTDNSGTVSSKKFMVVGTGIQNSGATISPSPTTGQSALADPLAYLTSSGDAPTAGSCTSQSSTPANGASLTSATFCNGLTLNSNVSVTLGAGTYYIENGINVDSGATLNGTAGVTLYIATGQANLNSGSTVELVAPTTGNLAGIALWQAASDTNEINLDSGATSEFDGAIYAPTAELTFNSGTNAAACTLVDVGSVMLDSGATFSIGSNCSAFSSSQAFKSGSNAMVE
jgi:Flp pilus assembly protein TadG